MPEHQTIEWKEPLYDEFLKWICGFCKHIEWKDKHWEK